MNGVLAQLPPIGAGPWIKDLPGTRGLWVIALRAMGALRATKAR